MGSPYHKKALFLSYFTVGYNLLEGIISVIAGIASGSIALVGFGSDSFIESLSGSVMIWRFTKGKDLSKEDEEKIEKKALRLIAYAFFILGAYILFEALKKLYLQETPEESLIGILIAIASLIIMPILYWQKKQTGKAMQSHSLVADSKQTLACIFMSVALLVGLGAYYLYAIWWLDPLVGIIIAVFLLKEGYTTLKEEKLCSC